MVFFIISTSTQKHTSRIVAHASNLEQAIELVKSCARDYVVEKNGPMIHREQPDDLKLTDQIHYFMRECPNQVHQVNVYRQSTSKVKGWVGSSYKERAELVKRFSYAYYEGIAMETEESLMTSSSTGTSRDVKKKTINRSQTMGFPPQIMRSLTESDAFKSSRRKADSNVLPSRDLAGPLCISEDEETTDEEARSE